MSDEEYDYDYSSGEEEYDYMENDEYDMEDCSVNKNISNLQLRGFYFKPAKYILPEMKDRIKDIAEALYVPESAAAILLREYNWSEQNLLEAYSNCPDGTKGKCGVAHRCSNSAVVASDKKAKCCPICYEPIESNKDNLGMACGHCFCLDCWHDYCAHEIAQGQSCVVSTCPESSCNEAITEEEIETYAPELLQKFQTFQLKNYIEVNSKTRWCPGKGCEQVACAQGVVDEDVAHCESCLVSFCFACGKEPHKPCGCKLLTHWEDKCQNDSETANWMTANTKNCPMCSTRIQKDGGCMFVSCSKCKHGFCWICMGTHHVWNCNKAPEESEDKTKAQNDLERYLHYFKRFDNHAKSQEYSFKQVEKIEILEAKMDANDACAAENSVWQDLTFLKDANRQLMKCHRVLKYTYAFAYFQFLDPSTKLKKNLFEDHQGLLESLTEKLAQSSEKPLTEVNSVDVKNQTRVIGGYIEKLLSFIECELD